MAVDEGGTQERIVRGDAELSRLVRQVQHLASLVDPIPASVERRAKDLAQRLGRGWLQSSVT
jgi:phage terminase Nu1 subunit (DNA packaging protein)